MIDNMILTFSEIASACGDIDDVPNEYKTKLTLLEEYTPRSFKVLPTQERCDLVNYENDTELVVVGQFPLPLQD